MVDLNEAQIEEIKKDALENLRSSEVFIAGTNKIMIGYEKDKLHIGPKRPGENLRMLQKGYYLPTRVEWHPESDQKSSISYIFYSDFKKLPEHGGITYSIEEVDYIEFDNETLRRDLACNLEELAKSQLYLDLIPEKRSEKYLSGNLLVGYANCNLTIGPAGTNEHLSVKQYTSQKSSSQVSIISLENLGVMKLLMNRLNFPVEFHQLKKTLPKIEQDSDYDIDYYELSINDFLKK